MSHFRIAWYEDHKFWYVWKPHGMPSSQGKNFSFLDTLCEYSTVSDDGLSSLISRALGVFGEDSELGMVNRLDNDTAGLLYFAKSESIFDEYKILQNKGRVVKYYMADLYGRIDSPKLICTPISHHQHLREKMVAWRGPWDDGKTRGQKHYVETYIEPIFYDAVSGYTAVSVMISQGMRHQIRIHCASIGSGVVGDILYHSATDKGEADVLHLWSVGMEIKP